MRNIIAGLGKAIVQKFYEVGAIVFAFDKDAEKLAELKNEFPEVNIKTVDLLNWEEAKAAVRSISPIHHLVNNAGIMKPARLMDATMEEFDL